MIRQMEANDRERLDSMQFELQKYFAEIDDTGESQPYRDMGEAHRYIQKMLDDVENMNGKIFVAIENDVIVGFVQGVVMEREDEAGVPPRASAREGWIGLLYVEPEYRGRGIGRELLSGIAEHFRSENCTCVKLKVLASNAHAIDVYEGYGFRQHELEMGLGLLEPGEH